jgi:hypothetical protein
MSPLHNPASGLTATQSHPPVSRNGASTNTVNGASIDLRGKRGAYFVLNAGVLTGAANYAAHLQTGDNPADAANANWTNVNTTTYPNAAVAVKTNANAAFEMDFDPVRGNAAHVRAVLVTDANAAVIGLTAVTF